MNQSQSSQDLSKMLLGNKFNVDRMKLVQLAVSDDASSLLDDLSSNDVVTQLRAFNLLLAKSEQTRVLQLTDALIKLEDAYIDRAMNDLDGMDMKGLASAIGVVTNSLNRATTLLDRATQDDNLQIIIDQSTTQINNHTNNNVLLVKDQSKRDKLRTIAGKLLKMIEAPEASNGQSDQLGDQHEVKTLDNNTVTIESVPY